MPEAFIPIFCEGVTHINANLAYKKENGRIYYFNGHEMPVFSHDESDRNSFRMIISQFYVNGNATQSEIIKTFGIPQINIKRAVKTFRERGPAGFFNTLSRRKPRVLTSEVIEKIQKLLDDGKSPREISNNFGLKQDTLQKAIRDGRLKKKALFQNSSIY